MTSYERLQDILLTIAHLHPDMPLSEALPLVYEVEAKAAAGPPAPVPAKLLTQADLDAFTRTVPAVIEAMTEGKRINAIKELRAALATRSTDDWSRWGGLKECKDSVNRVWPVGRR